MILIKFEFKSTVVILFQFKFVDTETTRVGEQDGHKPSLEEIIILQTHFIK